MSVVAVAVAPTAASFDSAPRSATIDVPVAVAGMLAAASEYITGRPTIDDAASICVDFDSAACSLSIFCNVSSCVNCAVCWRNCELSVGESGFWYFICATSSFRNVSLPNALSGGFGAAVAGVFVVLEIGNTWVIAAPLDPYVEQRVAVRLDVLEGRGGRRRQRVVRFGRGGLLLGLVAVARAGVVDAEIAGAHTVGIEPGPQVVERVAHELRGLRVLGVDRRVQHAVAQLDAQVDAP